MFISLYKFYGANVILNFQNCSKVSGFSHMRIFPAIEIAVKITPKVAVNIACANRP